MRHRSPVGDPGKPLNNAQQAGDICQYSSEVEQPPCKRQVVAPKVTIGSKAGRRTIRSKPDANNCESALTWWNKKHQRQRNVTCDAGLRGISRGGILIECERDYSCRYSSTGRARSS